MSAVETINNLVNKLQYTRGLNIDFEVSNQFISVSDNSFLINLLNQDNGLAYMAFVDDNYYKVFHIKNEDTKQLDITNIELDNSIKDDVIQRIKNDVEEFSNNISSEEIDEIFATGNYSQLVDIIS